MPLFELPKFEEHKSDNRREVKRAEGGLPNSLWATYSSFANCDGGVIVLGVDENPDGSWRTTGLTNEKKLLKEFWDTVNNKNKVSHNLLSNKDIEIIRKPGGNDLVMVIHVPAAKREDKPVYLNNDMFGQTYRRNGEGDYRCSAGEVKAMLRDQPDETPDTKVLEYLPFSYIVQESLKDYFERFSAIQPQHVFSKLGFERFAEQIGAAAYSSEDRQLHPTVAGLLMFGREYQIVREFPEYFLDYRETLDADRRWSDRLQSSSGDWTGNLYDFYFAVYYKLIRMVKIPFEMKDGLRIDDTPVHKAIREALANCIVNTDFYLPQSVLVRMTPMEMVFENPGDIRVGKKQMLKGGLSDPRNKTLLKMFNLIKIGERAGSGVPNIFDVWEDNGWEAPVVEERFAPNRTILRLSFVEKSGPRKSKPAMRVLIGGIQTKGKDEAARFEALLSFCEKPRSRTEMMEFLSLKDTKHFRESYLVPLLGSGALVMTLPDKPKSRFQKYMKGSKNSKK